MTNEGHAAFGHYDLEKLITIALGDDAMANLNHEIIHVLRNLGMFTPREWKTLVAESKAKFADRYADLLKLYPDAERVEESIAYAAMEEPEKATNFARRMWDRVRQFFKALKNFLVGRGFNTAEKIFTDIKAGKFKERARAAEEGDIVGNSPVPPANGGRKSYSLYAEARIPIFGPNNAIPGFHSLEFEDGVRFEEFLNNSSNVLVPKFGMRWQPLDEQLTLRVTWSEGYRQPSAAFAARISASHR